MSPKDPTTITREIINDVLKARMDPEILLRDCGLDRLLGFVGKGINGLPKVISSATRLYLLKAIHDFEMAKQGEATAMEILHFLREHILRALVRPTGTFLGLPTVANGSTNPFLPVIAACVNEELRAVWEDLYLGHLETLTEVMLREVMASTTNSIQADHRHFYQKVSREVSESRF